MRLNYPDGSAESRTNEVWRWLVRCIACNKQIERLAKVYIPNGRQGKRGRNEVSSIRKKCNLKISLWMHIFEYKIWRKIKIKNRWHILPNFSTFLPNLFHNIAKFLNKLKNRNEKNVINDKLKIQIYFLLLLFLIKRRKKNGVKRKEDDINYKPEF